MDELSTIFESVHSLEEAGKTEDASREFSSRFLLLARDVYRECVNTYPPKFQKVNDWCEWVRQFYILSDQAARALAKPDPEKPKERLDKLIGIRSHFLALHQMTETMTSGDHVFAFWLESKKDKPELEALKKSLEALKEATPSRKAAANKEDYEKSREEFQTAVSPILEADKLEGEALENLRKAAEVFFKKHGIQFE
jgi:hypothetical protein